MPPTLGSTGTSARPIPPAPHPAAGMERIVALGSKCACIYVCMGTHAGVHGSMPVCMGTCACVHGNVPVCMGTHACVHGIVHVCMATCLCAWEHTCMHGNAWEHMHLCMAIHMCAWEHVPVCMGTHACEHGNVSVWMGMCTCVGMHMCAWKHIHECMGIHTCAWELTHGCWEHACVQGNVSACGNMHGGHGQRQTWDPCRALPCPRRTHTWTHAWLPHVPWVWGRPARRWDPAGAGEPHSRPCLPLFIK